ncbi:hypothetical protein [Hymenobacter algoricola]|uniref:Transposase n=1 Tax=Hymenobacter algoricola TaxID=486267 RepID=A0ABP7N9J0_9BACT
MLGSTIQPAIGNPSVYAPDLLQAERLRLLTLVRARGRNQRGCYAAIKMIARIHEVLEKEVTDV